MWTNNQEIINNLESGYYWFREKILSYHTKKQERIIWLQQSTTKRIPETMDIGDDCSGPYLDGPAMKKDNAEIWNQKVPMPTEKISMLTKEQLYYIVNCYPERVSQEEALEEYKVIYKLEEYKVIYKNDDISSTDNDKYWEIAAKIVNELASQ